MTAVFALFLQRSTNSGKLCATYIMHRDYTNNGIGTMHYGVGAFIGGGVYNFKVPKGAFDGIFMIIFLSIPTLIA